MSWIKRNLFFVIGSLVALALMGGAGVYNYLQWKRNADVGEELNQEYAKLDRLYKLDPNPGNEKVDNIKAAKDQQGQVGAFIEKTKRFFVRIPPIPGPGRISGEDFTTALSKTIAQMQRSAANASVTLPPGAPGYSFSFEAQSRRTQFHGSLEPLAVQLGEVKTICDVLIQAGINSLDSVRRERVSADDQAGPQTDYLDQHSVTNELAVVTPYEITIRCFSAELASVLSGFASSPSGLLVRAINVAPAPSTAAAAAAAPGGAPVTVAPTVAPPVLPGARPRPGGPPPEGMMWEEATQSWVPLGRPPPGARTPQPKPVPTPSATPTKAPAASAGSGGPQIKLDEKPLQVTLLVYIVKLLPGK